MLTFLEDYRHGLADRLVRPTDGKGTPEETKNDDVAGDYNEIQCAHISSQRSSLHGLCQDPMWSPMQQAGRIEPSWFPPPWY